MISLFCTTKTCIHIKRLKHAAKKHFMRKLVRRVFNAPMHYLFPLISLFFSCNKGFADDAQSLDLFTMVVPNTFNYATSSKVNIDYTLQTKDGKPLDKKMVQLLDKPLSEGGEILYQGLTDKDGHIEQNISLPTHVNQVIFDYGIGGNHTTQTASVGAQRIVSNMSTSISTASKDTDGDGVIDDYDDFPNDPKRAYISWAPAKETYGTITYEDAWPNLGDYDMNDLVVDYNYQFVLNADNDVVEMYGEYVVRASGAANKNGFGVEFPFPPSSVTSVTGTRVINNKVVKFSSNGCEAGQKLAVFIAFDDAYSVMPVPNSWEYINTQKNAAFIKPDTIKMKMSFTRLIDPDLLGSVPFNPFIFVNKERGREVHIPGETPTDLATKSYFKTGVDDTDPARRRYYKTARNLPFALALPAKFTYPIERHIISGAYLRFIPWSQSNGVLFPNWYRVNIPAYRNTVDLYLK